MNERHEPIEIVDRRTKAADSSALIEEPEQVTLSEVDRVYSDPSPIKNYVLVRQNAKETFYAGTKFVIPETAQQSPNKGVVVAVGPELIVRDAEGNTISGLVKGGDIVTFSRFNAEPIDIDGEEFQLVRFTDIKLIESVTYALGV
jgi:co-chaperonin GroES (HSP10)